MREDRSAQPLPTRFIGPGEKAQNTSLGEAREYVDLGNDYCRFVDAVQGLYGRHSAATVSILQGLD